MTRIVRGAVSVPHLLEFFFIFFSMPKHIGYYLIAIRYREVCTFRRQRDREREKERDTIIINEASCLCKNNSFYQQIAFFFLFFFCFHLGYYMSQLNIVRFALFYQSSYKWLPFSFTLLHLLFTSFEPSRGGGSLLTLAFHPATFQHLY